MIVFDVHARQRRLRCSYLLMQLIGGLLVGLLLGIDAAAATGEEIAVLTIESLVALFSLVAMAHAASCLVAEFGFGEVRCRIIVNRKTLVVKPSGRPASFVKRRDVVALKDTLATLALRDGTTFVVYNNRFTPRYFADKFLPRFLDLWWPGLSAETLNRRFEESMADQEEKREKHFRLLFLPTLFGLFLVPIAIICVGFYGVLVLIFAVIVYLMTGLHLAEKEMRRSAARFEYSLLDEDGRQLHPRWEHGAPQGDIHS